MHYARPCYPTKARAHCGHRIRILTAFACALLLSVGVTVLARRVVLVSGGQRRLQR